MYKAYWWRQPLPHVYATAITLKEMNAGDDICNSLDCFLALLIVKNEVQLLFWRVSTYFIDFKYTEIIPV